MKQGMLIETRPDADLDFGGSSKKLSGRKVGIIVKELGTENYCYYETFKQYGKRFFYIFVDGEIGVLGNKEFGLL